MEVSARSRLGCDANCLRVADSSGQTGLSSIGSDVALRRLDPFGALAARLAPAFGLALAACFSSNPVLPPGGASTNRGGGASAADSDGGAVAPAVADASTDAGRGNACGVPFSPTGPWCYRLPATTPTASNS